MTDEKKVTGVYGGAATHWVGDGFPVRTIFPSDSVPQAPDPFLMLDYAGPLTVAPHSQSRGVGEHPHRGFETVTIVFQGYLQHRDSAGNTESIGPGDVQWMTAASGIVHEELYDPEFSRQGGTLEFMQLWVNLPEAQKMNPPRYQSLLKEQIPVTTLGPAGYVRVIAGEMSGVSGPAKTATPVGVFDLHVNAGHETELCLCAGHNAALVLLHGSVLVNGAEVSGEAQVALFDTVGSMVTVAARQDSRMLIVSGEPINESISSHGPFVMNTRQEIAQAVEDYRAGRMGHLR